MEDEHGDEGEGTAASHKRGRKEPKEKLLKSAVGKVLEKYERGERADVKVRVRMGDGEWKGCCKLSTCSRLLLSLPLPSRI